MSNLCTGVRNFEFDSQDREIHILQRGENFNKSNECIDMEIFQFASLKQKLRRYTTKLINSLIENRINFCKISALSAYELSQ